jgi:hypothetical protein
VALAKKLNTTAYAYPVYKVSQNAMASVVSMVTERPTAAFSVDKANCKVPNRPECLAPMGIWESEVSFMKSIKIHVGAPIKATSH